MDKKHLASILNDELTLVGFKRKGDYWVINGEQLTRMVNLQKSQYANAFYINFGYIIKEIPLNGLMMHVYNRLTSSFDGLERMASLLDLGNGISDEQREMEIREVVKTALIDKIQLVNTKNDLLLELEKRPSLNDVPLVVKQYFSLPLA